MVALYKLTNRNGTTYGNTQWGPGVRHEAREGPGPLCSSYWIHAYEDRYVAALMNHADANFSQPILWRFEAEGDIRRDGHKVGVKAGATVKRLPLPRFTTNQRVAFAIFCALEVYAAPTFRSWAEAWLSGEERSSERAAAAAAAARSAARVEEVAEAAARSAAWAETAIDIAALALKAYRWRDPLKRTTVRAGGQA